ncbi:UDP-glucoronosyl and UDP-glucosyl transferase family protein [Colletotrichum plurivorum]|uniref:UDP-glucoronosyl and UDP-glucosyl transferase family protein n=1 Tax=Colletotrichum plurivorum TaxID=2175906 RepID=A0A8H6N2T9_9PEZI|nr:UDP-glucoronosyl and UDP-glucosyl transferase family protein [Colletotrichum plurivorum]
MAKRGFLALAVLVGLVGTLLSFYQRTTTKPEEPPIIVGRNNTVLFVTNAEYGLSNVHLAAAFSLVEHHPEVTVHYASWANMGRKVERISAAARKRSPASPAIMFHELPPPDYYNATGETSLTLITPPGLKGIESMARQMKTFICPWTAEEHLVLYHFIKGLLRDIDPGVVVLDMLHRPAIDAVREENRLHAVLTPNTLVDLFAGNQPWLGALWKYPVTSSGFSFPVAWKDIPANAYMMARLAYNMLTEPSLVEKRKYLAAHGIKEPMDFFKMHKPGSSLMISQDTRGASIPLEYVPPNVTATGPIALSIATAEEQDPELAAWLARAPTVLVNLGSLMEYDDARGAAMAGALRVLLQKTGVQVLWKLHRRLDGKLDDSVWQPLVQEFVDSDRLRVSKWLTVDPLALLETGNIILSVHHGGANCYHEAVWAGVPHLILPAWVDLYNYGVLVEEVGLGRWGNRKAAPALEAEELSEAFLELVGDGPASRALRQNAKKLAKTFTRPGRDIAADEIAMLAARGH